MSDIYIPGVRSRFDSDRIIQDLMQLERLPRDRAAGNVSRLEAEKTYWQDLGTRISSLRNSARNLYSFQNPFNDRIVRSSNDSVLTATSVRGASELERSFVIKQTAQADRLLSGPLDSSFRVEAGNYSFSVGDEEISFEFRGGTLREFADALNRRGRDRIEASLVQVRPGINSLLIESKVTGTENSLGFSEAAEALAIQIEMVGEVNDSRRSIMETFHANAGERASIPIYPSVTTTPGLTMKFQGFTSVRPVEEWISPAPPPGPSFPSTGSVSFGGLVIENAPSSVSLPPWEAPPQEEDMAMISLVFSDGTSLFLSPIADSSSFRAYEFSFNGLDAGKEIVSIDLINNNNHRDLSLRNIELFDPGAGTLEPLNAISTAQNAIITMEGIEIERTVNTIDDLVPGITLNLRAPSDRPVNITVGPNEEGVRDSIISLVANYNRLMAEVNILTRLDPRILDEITYFTPDEREEYRSRLGVFQADSSLNQFRNLLQRAVSAPYPTSLDRELALLSQIGIGTDMGREGASAGLDPSRLRGYLEIDPNILDDAIATKLPAIRELFGSDTTGDLLVDTGLAFNIENIVRPFVETGGIITLKTNTVDTRIGSEQRRIDTMDRQLASREAELRVQYAQMENAFNRMERMGQSLDLFNQQQNNRNR